MKDAHAIFWWLFWETPIEALNQKVTEADRRNDFEQVVFFCKIIALKSMNVDVEEFWKKEVIGIC